MTLWWYDRNVHIINYNYYFFTLGINNREEFKKLSYAIQRAGMAVSPPPGQSCHVAE